MTIATMLSLGETALKLGLICSLTVLALFLSYSMLNVCDLSTDGCFTFGAAVGAVVAVSGHPFLSIVAAMAAGVTSGFVTAILQTKLGVDSLLAGIIVNNGIVLVDYINQLRAQGMEKKEAIMTAGRTRMRPVLMTAMTTILALSTMVFSHDMGADMSRPMSVVTIGGLTYGTLLTLIVIPCIYDVFSRGKERGKRGRKKLFLKEGKKEQADE